MPRKGRGSKPTNGRKNFENHYHIESPSVSKKPNTIQTHHAGTVHLDSGDNISGVVLSIGNKRETMADREDHGERTDENQVSGE